jgi:hypothetical protein
VQHVGRRAAAQPLHDEWQERIGRRLTLQVVRAGELREIELVPHELEG